MVLAAICAGHRPGSDTFPVCHRRRTRTGGSDGRSARRRSARDGRIAAVLILSLATILLVAELWPAPRPLYSAAISPVYDTIAADPRPVRVLTLPFGVRDGVSSAGNFRARTQFNQTRHGKTLIGGYLSRISQKRIARMSAEFPTLATLMKLSESRPLEAEDLALLRSGGAAFVSQANLGYVVLDERFITRAKAAPVIDGFGLHEIQRDAHLILYATSPLSTLRR